MATIMSPHDHLVAELGRGGMAPQLGNTGDRVAEPNFVTKCMELDADGHTLDALA